MTPSSLHRLASRRAVAIPLLVLYLLVLGVLALGTLRDPFIGRDEMRAVKLIPFVAAGGFGASAPIEILGNVVAFLPLGVLLGLLAPAWHAWQAGLVAAAVSTAVEVAQYIGAVGSSDTTDVIVNTVGGVLGLALLTAVRRRLRTGSASG